MTKAYHCRRRSPPIQPQRQNGVALIAMLLVFSLVVIIVGTATHRASLDIRKSGFHLNYSQAYQYALGAEALARQMLHQDWQEDQTQKRGDHLNEDWAQAFQFQPDGGLMRVQITDLNGRFNLNRMLDADGNRSVAVIEQFQKLLQQLDINREQGHVIADWLDRDTQPQSSRSEDVYYQSQTPAYRSADQRILSTSELKAMNLPLNPQELELLVQSTSALPEINTSVNPNTAEAAVLASLNSELNVDALIAARAGLEQGFTSAEEFLQHPLTAGLSFDANTLDTRSRYFEVWIVAEFNDQIAYLRSLLHRDPQSGAMTTLQRDQSPHRAINPLLNTTSATDR